MKSPDIQTPKSTVTSTMAALRPHQATPMKLGASRHSDYFRRWRWVAAAWLSCFTALRAHDENSLVIQQLTTEIEAAPTDANLYLRRAEMHRLIQHWHAAETDYQRAAHLAPNLATVDLAAATMWNDAAKPEQALPLLDRFLLHEPASAVAYAERARSQRLLKQWAAAAANYASVFDHSTDPEPELFADWADSLRNSGSPAQALAVLNCGISRIGQVASLETMALQLEISLQQYAAALTRVEAMLERPGRRDSILLIKAEILLAADRRDEAHACVALARQEFDSVPEARRFTSAGEKLAADLDRLAAKTVTISATPNPSEFTK